MSLVRIALRMMTVAALKGRTLAGENVLDSEIGVISEDNEGLRVNKHSKDRFISVYTDDAEAKPDEMRPFHANGAINLCIEYCITDAMIDYVDDPDNPGEKIEQIIDGIPHADRIHEFYLDLLGRQIRTALADGANEAAEILRHFVLKVVKITCERAGSERKGERVAAQKLTYTVEVLCDPAYVADIPDGSPLSRFFAFLAASDVDDQKLATLMRDQIPATPDDIEAARMRTGATHDEFAKLGLGFLPDADDTSAIDTVTVELDGSNPIEVSNAG
ncbi:hypothetical protein [uncultured Roseibium sp.]|uniref:hypothetical protein n=1 Tax=uncultured Roseibium sp. TaxID=1936171 RepID=UPI002623BB09|nr:hypothetical protein [uncultured Roseibium sp.]